MSGSALDAAHARLLRVDRHVDDQHLACSTRCYWSLAGCRPQSKKQRWPKYFDRGAGKWHAMASSAICERIEQAKQANQAGQGASQARRTCKPRAASPRMVVTRNSSHSPRRAETEGAPSRHVSPFVLLSYSQKAALASRAPKNPAEILPPRPATGVCPLHRLNSKLPQSSVQRTADLRVRATELLCQLEMQSTARSSWRSEARHDASET